MATLCWLGANAYAQSTTLTNPTATTPKAQKALAKKATQQLAGDFKVANGAQIQWSAAYDAASKKIATIQVTGSPKTVVLTAAQWQQCELCLQKNDQDNQRLCVQAAVEAATR